MIARCQNRWSVHVVEGWHRVTVEHDCTKTAGHDRPCRCACGMPEPLPPSEQRRTTDMQEDSLPKQEIQIVPAESWMDRPVKVHITTSTVTGSTSQTVYLAVEEAQELYDKLGAYLAGKKPPRVPRTDYERAWDGAMDGGRLG